MIYIWMFLIVINLTFTIYHNCLSSGEDSMVASYALMILFYLATYFTSVVYMLWNMNKNFLKDNVFLLVSFIFLILLNLYKVDFMFYILVFDVCLFMQAFYWRYKKIVA